MPIDPSLLFHGTGIYNLAAIALSDRLDEGVHWGKRGEPHGPRLTREWGQAEGFIAYAAPELREGGIVVLDRAALEADYLLQAYIDTFYEQEDCLPALGAHEAEEVVLTPSVTPLSRYLRALVCDPAVIEEARKPETMAFAQATGGWPFDEGEAGEIQARAALDALATSPFFNAWVPPSGYPVPGFPQDKPAPPVVALLEPPTPSPARPRSRRHG